VIGLRSPSGEVAISISLSRTISAVCQFGSAEQSRTVSTTRHHGAWSSPALWSTAFRGHNPQSSLTIECSNGWSSRGRGVDPSLLA
jgi:hypothetical protein